MSPARVLWMSRPVGRAYCRGHMIEFGPNALQLTALGLISD